MVCEKCRSEMRFKQVGHTVEWICDNCGESVAATCFEPYETDPADYHIFLTAPFTASVNIIKLVSEISNRNYVESKRLIESSPAEIFCGKAADVLRIRNKLRAANVEIRIEPDFPY